MATGKRYYWIKLRETFMSSDVVDFLMSQTDGANYVVLYQMLCLKTINTAGRLARTIGEIVIPYDVSKIQRDCKWFTADTIRVALELYKKFGLVYEDVDGTLVMTGHNDLVGSETNWAMQKRHQMVTKAQKQLNSPASGGNKVESKVENFHPDIRDKEIRDKEIRDREIESKSNNNITSGEPTEVGTPQQQEKPPIFTLPCIGGGEFPLTQEDVDKWAELYPAVDVPQEIRAMIGWLDANPSRRKTVSGAKRFANNWLSKAQNQGGAGYAKRGRDSAGPRQVYGGEEVL
nr:MAG TPA: Replication initiation and membrane attachment [Caudoviricetes sp.]